MKRLISAAWPLVFALAALWTSTAAFAQKPAKKMLTGGPAQEVAAQAPAQDAAAQAPAPDAAAVAPAPDADAQAPAKSAAAQDSAKNAVALQALISPQTNTVTRFDGGKIDFPSISKQLSEAIQTLTLKEEEKASVQKFLTMEFDLARKTWEDGFAASGVKEIYSIKDKDGLHFLAIPIAGLTPEAIQKIAAGGTSPRKTVFERFGFLVIATSVDSEKLKTRFAAPNDKEFPTVVAALGATEGAAFAIVLVDPNGLFPPADPSMAEEDPLHKFEWAAVAFSLVNAPRVVILIKMTDAEAAKNIVDLVETLINAPPTEMSLQAIIKAKTNGDDANSAKTAEFIKSFWNAHKPEIKGAEIGMVVEVIPLIKSLNDTPHLLEGIAVPGGPAPAAGGAVAPEDDIFEE